MPVFRASLLSFLISFMLLGCSSEEPETQPAIPGWVFNPSVQDGLAATGCVRAIDQMNTDSSGADLAARKHLAAKIYTQTQAMTQKYQNKANLADGGTEVINDFVKVVQQIVDQKLANARRINGEYVMINDQQEFCSLVAIGSEALSDINQAIDSAGRAAISELKPLVKKQPADAKEVKIEAVDPLPEKVKQEPSFPAMPDWVESPEVDSGLSFSACTPSTSSQSEDANTAGVLARKQLGYRLLLQMDNLVSSFDELKPVPEQTMQDMVFANMSQMKRVKDGYFQKKDEVLYCSLVSLSEANALGLLESFVEVASSSKSQFFTSSQEHEIFQSRQSFERMDTQLR